MYRAAVLALLAAGCAPMAEPQSSAAAPAFDDIAFEIKSWGRPIDSWSVGADGKGTHTKMVDDDPSSFRSYSLEQREFEVSPAQFARLSGMAAALPRVSRENCKERATDLPYGTVSLTQGGTKEAITFDVGCFDKPYAEFVRQLRAMDAAVTEWAETTAPVRTEAVEE